jgi:hypothetical protein
MALRSSRLLETDAPVHQPPVVNEQWQQQEAEMIAASDDLSKLSPTSGEPISLLHVPAGTQLVIQLRPQDLWQESNQFREFRASLTAELGEWIQQQIIEVTLRPTEERLADQRQADELKRFAAEIEELTICVVLGSRGSVPEVSAVVRMAQPRRRSEMIGLLEAERQDFTQPVFSNGEYAWLLLDESNFVVGPMARIDEMLGASEYPNPATNGLEAIVPHTDRNRHVTVIFKPKDLAVHAEALVTKNVIPAAEHFSEWFGKDVETAAWSLHLSDSLFLETLLRNQSQVTVPRLERNMRVRLAELPQDVLGLVKMMNPSQTGYRKIIGRFPAMTKVFAMSTRTGFDTRLVRMTTILPERAAPNLALATVLTWSESTFDYLGTQVAAAIPKRVLPNTVAERLQLPIEIEFKATPLQEACDLIGSDIGVSIKVDGEALKMAGYTQNLKQTFNLGTAPAIKLLKAIVDTKDQEQIAYVVDEANKTINVVTRAAAAERGQTTLKLE